MLKLCKLNVGPSNMTYDPPVGRIARNVLIIIYVQTIATDIYSRPVLLNSIRTPEI